MQQPIKIYYSVSTPTATMLTARKKFMLRPEKAVATQKMLVNEDGTSPDKAMREF